MEPRAGVHLLARAALAACVVSLGAAEAAARVLMTQKDALAVAFPGQKPERRTAFLSDEVAAAAEKLARSKFESRVWSYYVGRSSSGAEACAYFDRVIVRTMPTSLMAVVASDGKLLFVEVLSFDEPEDYLPRPRWLELFRGRPLSEDLRVGGLLRNVSGATLTSFALAESVRRMLALHAVLQEAKP